MREALESLERLQRSALELAHRRGMNVEAIASALDEEPAAIRRALREALLRLAFTSAETLK